MLTRFKSRSALLFFVVVSQKYLKSSLRPVMYWTMGMTFLSLSSQAQQNSEHGWVLAPYDTLRILTVFAEIDYSETDVSDPHPGGTGQWKPAELPLYADSLFDVFPRDSPRGVLSRYYRDISMGHLTVLGDYYPKVVTVPYALARGKGLRGILQYVTDHVERDDRLSFSGLEPSDFDFWIKSPGAGKQKSKSNGEFEGIDHISIILRNHFALGNGSGQASGSGIGLIGGKKSNTYSVFGGGSSLPFNVFKHELNHLFLGGNNFHAGGGNEARFLSYNYCVQGGWAMMGAANASLLTCSAWDRYRLGWRGPDKAYLISALDTSGGEVQTDLSAAQGAGTYILRDFVTTGDAIRIALPYIPEEEFPQWLWLENHLTVSENGSPFDAFQYRKDDCIEDAKPALFIQRQIDAEEKVGPHIYGSVHADYLKPLTANGSYDLQWEDSIPDLPHCVNSNSFRPYKLESEWANPLTGNHQLEFPLAYTDSTRQITAANTVVPGLWKTGDRFVRLPYLGHPSYGFSSPAQSRIGIGTNPSTASALTMLNNRRPRTHFKRNSNAVYLSGLCIEILDKLPDGSIKVSIRFDDASIEDTVRWAAPKIVLSDHRPGMPDMVVTGNLILDRGKTLTRFSEPDTVEGKLFFTDRTKLIVKEGAELNLKGSMKLRMDSELHLKSGSRLSIDRDGIIQPEDHSSIWLFRGAGLTGRGKITLSPGTWVYCETRENYKQARRMARPRKRVRMVDGWDSK